MYINMNKMLRIENKESLTTMIQLEAEKRIESATRVYDKLARVHLTEDQIKKMFQMLTVDKVAKITLKNIILQNLNTKGIGQFIVLMIIRITERVCLVL